MPTINIIANTTNGTTDRIVAEVFTMNQAGDGFATADEAARANDFLNGLVTNGYQIQHVDIATAARPTQLTRFTEADLRNRFGLRNDQVTNTRRPGMAPR